MRVFQTFLRVAVGLTRGSPFEFCRNRSGSVAILTAVGLTMILGALGLGKRYVNGVVVDHNLVDAVDIASNSHVTMTNCDLWDNSTAPKVTQGSGSGAFEIAANSSLAAHSVNIAGGTYQAQAGSVSPVPNDGSSATADPYENLDLSLSGSCSTNCTMTN